jgi:cytochrome d ubiquinol oxidase subunit II
LVFFILQLSLAKIQICRDFTAFPALAFRSSAINRWPTIANTAPRSCVIQPGVLTNYRSHPVLFIIPAGVALSLLAIFLYHRRGNDKAAFLSSCAYLVLMLVGAAAAVYPNLLLSTTDPSLNITIYNAAAGPYSLKYGLIWWTFGMALAIGYFIFVYRMFRGKIPA